MIYEFYWDNGKERQLIEIESSDAVAVESEAIEKLLDEYRKDNDEYNIDDWCEYLTKLGYRVRAFKPDYSLHF